MKTTINAFLNEENNKLPKKDHKYDFLVDLCNKASYDKYSKSFHLKELIEIGTRDGEPIFLNSIGITSNDELSFHFLFNKTISDLYGTDWEFGIIYEDSFYNSDDISLRYNKKRHSEIILNDNYMDIIFNNIKNYKDLDSWIEKTISIRKTHNDNSSFNAKNAPKTNLRSWEDEIKYIENKIDYGKYILWHSEPYETSTLKEMIELGEEKYRILDAKRNKRLIDIFNDFNIVK